MVIPGNLNQNAVLVLMYATHSSLAYIIQVFI